MIPALGHDWGEWETVTEAAPGKAGEKQRKCARCGETESETIPALPQTFTVTFDTDGGTPVPEAQEVEAGGHALRPETDPVKDGYIFRDWFEGDKETVFDFDVYAVSEDTTVYALWTELIPDAAPTYTVTFDVQGHGTAPAAITGVESGSRIEEPEAPKERGWAFGGWFLDEDCTEAWDFAEDTVTGDLTLYGKWTKKSSGNVTEKTKTYSVKLNAVENGEVQCASKAEAGHKVWVGVTPDEGYVLESITVRDAKGNSLEVKVNPDGSRYFEMPEGNVTVTVTFAKTSEPEPEPEEVPEPERPFEDVAETDWFYEAVYYCFDRGWFKGVSETEFAPDMTMSRAMFATVLYRLSGSPETAGENPFSDVEEGKWYTEAVIWAAENGVVYGYEDGRFGINDPVTREQMVTMLWRWLGKPAGTGDLSEFEDEAKISPWAKEAFSWAVGEGVIHGKGDGILDPGGESKRSEVAQMLMNYDRKA